MNTKLVFGMALMYDRIARFFSGGRIHGKAAKAIAASAHVAATVHVRTAFTGQCKFSCERLGTSGPCLEHLWNKTLGFRDVFQSLPEVKAIESSAFMERAMGIEPTSAK
jgi:hypothetical protein